MKDQYLIMELNEFTQDLKKCKFVISFIKSTLKTHKTVSFYTFLVNVYRIKYINDSTKAKTHST